MKIQSSGETFELPPPMPAEGEIVVTVARYVPVDLPEADGAAPVFSLLNLRKILFFACREGVSLTLAKVRAVLSHRKLVRRRTLVIAIGTAGDDGRPALAIGGQDCPHAEQLCFARPLVRIGANGGAGPAGDLEALVPALRAYCAAHPAVAAALRDWSPFAGAPPAATIETALAEGQALAADGPGAAAFEPVPVTFPAAPAAIRKTPPAVGRTGLFLAGAGTYPCAYALPLLSRAGIPFDTVIERHPARAAGVAGRFGFAHADTDAARGLERLTAYKAPVLVIATYHSTHFDIARAALAINPATRIMLEKPPVTTLDQLDGLRRLRGEGGYIEIGYNRRHVPMTAEARAQIAAESGPIVMTCIVKELAIPPSHWYRWPAQGTRVTGNLCHWLDLARHFIDAEAERMVVVGGPAAPGDGTPGAAGQRDDNTTLIVRYADGSRLHIVATEHGNALRGVQELIEVRRGELTLVIDDFLRLRVQRGAAQSTRRRRIRDKGHGRMYARFIANVTEGRPAEYPDADLYATTVQYIRAAEALGSGAPVSEIDLRAPVSL
jgi:predicted dehydrogenase